MENRPCCDRNLILTRTALKQQSRTVKTASPLTTPGTCVTIRPAEPKQVRHTGFITHKSTLKLNKAHRLLLHYPVTSRVIVSRLLDRLLESGDSYFSGVSGLDTLSKSLSKTMSALRISGISPDDIVPSSFESPEKAHDIVWLLTEYLSSLNGEACRLC